MGDAILYNLSRRARNGVKQSKKPKTVRLSLYLYICRKTCLTRDSGSIPYPELLAYAQALSAFTSAPPNMPDMSLPGQPPPPLFFPPFPNEEKMRRGRLNAETPLGMPGEIHSIGRGTLYFIVMLLRKHANIFIGLAPSMSPEVVEPRVQAPTSYRVDAHPQHSQPFDFDLDLNPDL